MADLGYFLVIARHRSFRAAGQELGISASALSHSLRGLEERLGLRLLNRTSRSVTLTAAGSALFDGIEPSMATIVMELEALNHFRETPAGRIRLNVLGDAAPLLLAPVLPTFVERYPDIDLDISVDNRMLDVVGDGFDAGIRYGGTVPEDMIARRLSADLRWVVAASPAYLARHGTPLHPRDLLDHRCLGMRLGDGSLYKWEFGGPEGEFSLPLPGTITVDDTRFLLSLGQSGASVIFGLEACITPLCKTGDLVTLLPDWSSVGPGFHAYYAGRRQLPTPLRLLLDLIRELRPLGL